MYPELRKSRRKKINKGCKALQSKAITSVYRLSEKTFFRFSFAGLMMVLQISKPFLPAPPWISSRTD